MTAHKSNDPLHGVTLEMQVNALVEKYGWAKLGKLININCFKNDPSVKSSLKFLRRTPWPVPRLRIYISIHWMMMLPKTDSIWPEGPW